MNSFLTGSHAYGTPREDSDIDICIRIGDDDWLAITNLADSEPGSAGTDSLKFGKVNLIRLSDEKFEAWKEATDELVKCKPVTRDEAVALIKLKMKASTK